MEPNIPVDIDVFCVALPLVSPYLDEDDLLELRLVCRRMRDDVSKRNSIWHGRDLDIRPRSDAANGLQKVFAWRLFF
jgi:hypothetical protein